MQEYNTVWDTERGKENQHIYKESTQSLANTCGCDTGFTHPWYCPFSARRSNCQCCLFATFCPLWGACVWYSIAKPMRVRGAETLFRALAYDQALGAVTPDSGGGAMINAVSEANVLWRRVEARKHTRDYLLGTQDSLRRAYQLNPQDYLLHCCVCLSPCAAAQEVDALAVAYEMGRHKPPSTYNSDLSEYENAVLANNLYYDCSPIPFCEEVPGFFPCPIFCYIRDRQAENATLLQKTYLDDAPKSVLPVLSMMR